MQLEGKIVVVTGAGSGIGKALVKKFISEGAKKSVSNFVYRDSSGAVR